MNYLNTINSPQDLKKLEIHELDTVAKEIREAVLNRDSKIGGHVGPNLGIVETTIALHYVFNSPQDKIVFDVSHQCYPHKILTGRQKGFIGSDEEIATISGYTNPTESIHDFFVVGHTSTSVSLACGLAKARDLRNEKHNIIALIGDGSLSGGEALEGLSNAAVLGSNIIIILNDNEMSIAENHGGLYTNLRLLRQTNGTAECNMFKALGFEYRYIEEGNSISKLIETFKQIKDSPHPVLLHIHTTKGKGYLPAEEDKEKWHWNLPFDIKSGQNTLSFDNSENYTDITFNYLNKRLEQDKNIVVVTAGTPGAVGLTPERRSQLGQNYVDVGIAEEHAVAFSSALAKGGCKPVFCVWSSFVQRTYDQLSQDLALNNNPAVILVFSGAISAMDATHLGCFDIPLISNIPNIVYLAPTTKEEYLSMLNWGLEQTSHPVVIRVPTKVISDKRKISDNYDNLNTYEIVKQGRDIAVLALGSFFNLGQEVCKKLHLNGIDATLINPRYISGIDQTLLSNLKKDHKIIVTIEDGVLNGGFGEKISRFYGGDDIKVLNFGAQKEFTDRIPLNVLYQRYHLTPDLIVEDILKLK